MNGQNQAPVPIWRNLAVDIVRKRRFCLCCENIGNHGGRAALSGTRKGSRREIAFKALGSTRPEKTGSQIFFRSSGTRPSPTFDPRLTPWAAFWRRSATHSGRATPPVPHIFSCDTDSEAPLFSDHAEMKCRSSTGIRAFSERANKPPRSPDTMFLRQVKNSDRIATKASYPWLGLRSHALARAIALPRLTSHLTSRPSRLLRSSAGATMVAFGERGIYETKTA